MLTRFELMSLLALFAALGSPVMATPQKNVLFIAVDDLRPELGCYGASHIHSPNIDRFAATALRFDRAYCQQAVCNPSRTSLMTGLRPDTIGVTGNHSHFRSKMRDVVTLPQHFKRNGYHAAAIGKLYHGVFPDGASITKWDTMGDPESWSVPALRFGPRYYYTERGIAAARATFERVYRPSSPSPDDWTRKLVFGPATESPEVADNILYDGKVADAAVATLRDLKKNPAQPFFLAVGFIKPHSPYIAPKKYFELYDDVELATNTALPEGSPRFVGHESGELRRYTDQPRQGEIAPHKQRRIRQAYYACVSYIDAQIGRVLDELKRLGLADNTIVSLYGDHGYHLGEQGLWGKTTNFELDTRVPLIIRNPGMQAAGRVTKSLVELVDLYPTLAELAGLPVSDRLEGKSLAALLDAPEKSVKGVALSQYPRRGGLMGYSMRTPTHRLTQWVHRATGEVRATELFEYADGPVESKNIASDSPQMVRELAAKFATVSPGSFKPRASTDRKRIRVACVGDSITFGYGIPNRSANSYPALLQKMLGDRYEVRNFGFSGATLLKQGHKPYWQKAPYAASLKFEPDIVVINLGANDAIDQNWKPHGHEFVADYRSLIASYRALGSKPSVTICEALPIFPNHGRFKECRTNRNQMEPMIRSVAQAENTGIIDLHKPFEGRGQLFPDGLHPGKAGALEIAQHVFTSLTGKQPPNIAVAEGPPQSINAIDFEQAKAGDFKSLKSPIGTWKAVAGRALIDNRHAASGRQCLHLAGGPRSSVELVLNKQARADGHLTFRAERWTKRAPFAFRIEKLVRNNWSEIYNGDNKVRVGRSFLSSVEVPLEDASITGLRFTVTSPPNTGILIDDLRIAPARPQKITGVEVVPFALPALVGKENCPLLKLKIDTVGRKNPISLTGLRFGLGPVSDLNDISVVRIFAGGSGPTFAAAVPFGSAHKAAATVNASGHLTLAEGSNYVWVTCKLDDAANIDHRVGATCESVVFSNGESFDLKAAPSIQNTGVAVRNAGDDGVHTYRIPGLATTKRGSLIAVYDVRRRGGGDLPGDIDVGMSRSTDGGRTWEAMKVIMDMGNDPKFRYDGVGDPTILVDKTTGTVWCAATWSHGNRSWFGSQPGLKPEETGQFMLVRSDDDGVTWSQPINITRQVKKPEWSFLLQGPGKGITMNDGTIVFPAQYQDPPDGTDRRANRLPHSAFIFSRDHGKTWSTSAGAYDDTTESQVVELADGELMLNCRYNRESKRVVMTTRDMGQTWREHSTNRQALIEPRACMASVINVGRELRQLGVTNKHAERDNFLLFSNPDSLNGRNHITIKASLDGGGTWPPKHHLLLDEERGAGYSCMTMIDAETVGIIYEGSQAHMTFQRVKLADILDPPKDQKTKNPTQAPGKTALIHRGPSR